MPEEKMFTGINVIGDSVYCPCCGSKMNKVAVKDEAHARDKKNRLVSVARVFYGCPNGECNSVCWFDYRKDGRPGDLHLKIQEGK